MTTSTSTSTSTLCRLPWTGFSIEADGGCRPCCIAEDFIRDDEQNIARVTTHSVTEILHSASMVALRDSMRKGERPDLCSHCWRDEDVGVESKRQFYLKPPVLGEESSLNFDVEPTKVIELQVVLNNTCNIKCRTCCPAHSSLWVKEANYINKIGLDLPPMIQDIRQMSITQTGSDTSKFWTDREDWYSDIVRLEIMGGEPLFAKQWHKIFNELIDSGKASTTVVSMSSNGVLYYPELMDRMIANFKFVDVALSIDGVGTTFNYMRHPAKWDVVLPHIKKYVHLLRSSPGRNFQTSVTYTLSWMNVLDLPYMHQLFASEQWGDVPIWHNLVRGPDYFALWAIPEEFKYMVETVLRTIDHTSIDGIIGFMYSGSVTDDQFLKALRILQISDQYRNEDLLESIPDWAPFLKDRWKETKELYRGI